MRNDPKKSFKKAYKNIWEFFAKNYFLFSFFWKHFVTKHFLKIPKTFLLAAKTLVTVVMQEDA